jgi:fibronectin-binding autotransporter adhesin
MKKLFGDGRLFVWVAFFTCAFSPSPAPATNLFWDGTGTGWNSASSWSTANNATIPNPALPPGSSDIAFFNITTVTGAQTVNLNANQSALGLNFTSTGTVFIQSGAGTNTLTLGSSGIAVNAGAGADTISSLIALGAAQTWTNNSSNLLKISNSISNGANTLIIAGTGNTSFASTAALGGGSGGLTMNGSGTLSIDSTNTFTGNLIVNSGVVSISTAANVGNAALVAVQTGGTLQTNADLTLPTTLNVGTGGATINTNIGTLTVGSAGFGITGAGALTKTGSGTLAITGTTNSYSGGTVINGGILQVGADGGLGNAAGALSFDGGTLKTSAAFSSARSVTINAGNGTIDPSAGDLTLSGAIGGAGELLIIGAGTVTLSNSPNTYAGGTAVLSGATVAISTDKNLGSLASSLILNSGTVKALADFGSNRLIALNPSGGGFDTNGFDVSLSGTLISSGGLIKFGNGTLTLSNTGNSYAGGTNIVGGTVAVGADSNLGSTSGSLVFNGGTLRTTASFSSARQVLLSNTGGGGTIDTAGNDLTLSGLIANTGGPTGGLIKLGDGTLTLTNTFNSYAGPTSIQGGVLAISSLSNLGNTSSLTVDGGTLRTTSTMFYSGPVTLGAGNATFDTTAGGQFNLLGTIGGPGSLTKTSIGALQLGTASTVNTYAGGTTATGGSLLVNADSNLGAAGTSVAIQNATLEINTAFSSNRPLTLTGAATIALDLTGGVTWSGAISGTGSLNKTGTGTLTLTNNTNSYQGGTIVNVGPLIVSTDANLGAAAGGITIANNATLVTTTGFTTSRSVTLNNGATIQPTSGFLILNGNVTGTGPLIVSGIGNGASRLTLGSASNSYTGGTSINGGFLSVFSDANLGNAAGGLTLDNGTLQVFGSYSTSRTVGVGAGNGTFDTNGNNITLNGPLTVNASGALIKTGTGPMTVLNPSYAGRTQVIAGQLILTSGSLSSSVNVASGATLSLNGTTMNEGTNSLFVSSGGTIEYRSNSVFGGYLTGNGIHRVPSDSTFTFFSTSNILNGADVRLDGQTSFTNVFSGGKITTSSQPFTWSGGANSSSGNLIVGGSIATQFWSSDGVITINPGGSLSNTSNNLVLGGGSRTTINASGSLSTQTGTTIELNGGLLVNNGTITGTVNVNYGSLAKGVGTYDVVHVTDGGVFAPGNSPGIVTAASALFDSGSTIGGPTLLIELAGTTPGAQYDQLHVTGQLSLGGTLAVSLINGFTPSAGNSFDILDFGTLIGTFNTINLPALGAGLMWNASQLYVNGILRINVAGDYNSNGIVDAADYVVWRKTLGQTGAGLAADGNANNQIDQGDFDIWRAHLGQIAGSGSVAIGLAVPEPTAAILFLAGLIGFVPVRRIFAGI